MMTAGRRHRRRGHRKTMKGGVYTTDVSQSIAGFPTISSIREVAGASYDTRGGNNTTGGRRRRHHKKTHRKGGKRRGHRKTHKGGSYGTPVPSDLALNVPRAGYGYVGTGVAGMTDPTPTY